jgi:tetratricopeptide (TPR) repeat protein
VLELNPLFVDAYESLGVILSRHEQYDEAIALMHKLQSLQPDSVMAHTNLSVYYMQLGDKERAEEEKAIAMSIRMSQLAREHAQKKKETEDRGKLLQEAEKRLEMFRQVLLIDPDDFLANNGVGTVYVEIGQYEEAIPYLEKTIKSKPTHTVAYLALGQAFENLAKFAEAINVYRSGIDVAAKRGDITPMKEMQLHLAAAEAAQKK